MKPEIKAGSIITEPYLVIRVFYIAHDEPNDSGFFPCTHIICDKETGCVKFLRHEAGAYVTEHMQVVGQSPFEGKNLCDLVPVPAVAP